MRGLVTIRGVRVFATARRTSDGFLCLGHRNPSLAASPRPPTRDRAGPRWLDLLAQREPPGAAFRHHAARMGVAAAPVVALGLDQHVLTERRQELVAERAAVRRRLEVLGRPDRPPSRRVGHPPMVARGQWLRSASTSSLLFIFERPSMPISAARFWRSSLLQ